ncbi:LysR family transcriptional regulator [Hyphomonas sp.]|uniref:LysR family transcriptional regulator n=1 Tax=Hyphomonas sp. TaxID=87 RepID=UPI0030FA2BC3
MLNASWLETFTVLCETGHFTHTAERLSMTQPGVSQHLRKLEHQVGQSLIAQQGKSFSLTPAGEAVLAIGRARREEERRLRELIEADDPKAGRASIACSGSFAMLLYPRMLAMMQDAPELAVHLEAAPQAAVLAGVLEGRFDLGVIGQDPAHPRLDAEYLGKEELCLVLPAGTQTEMVTFDQLETRGFVAHPDGYSYADELFSLNFTGSFSGADRLRVRTYVNQISQIPAPVAQGIGYTLLPRSGVDAYSGKADLAIASLAKRKYHELWLVFRRGRPLSARLERLAELTRDVVKELAD